MVDDRRVKPREGLEIVLNVDGFGGAGGQDRQVRGLHRGRTALQPGLQALLPRGHEPDDARARCCGWGRRRTSWSTSEPAPASGPCEALATPPRRAGRRAGRPTPTCPATARGRHARDRRADADRPRSPRRSRRAGVRRGAIPVAGGRRSSASRPSWSGSRPGRPFGHYHYSDKLGPRVGGVPLLAAAAWAMMSRPAWVVAGLLSRRRALRVPLAAGALTAWDVFLDPRMARDGYWIWPDGGRYEGVPASNFARLVRRPGWASSRSGACSTATTAAARTGDGALALYVWTWVGESVRQRGALAPAGHRRGGRRWRWAPSPCRRWWRGGARDEDRRRRRRGRRPRRGDPARPRGPPRDRLRAGGRRRRQVRPRGARRLRVGLRAVAADDAVGVRGAVRRDRRAAGRRARAAAGGADHPLRASPTAARSSYQRRPAAGDGRRSRRGRPARARTGCASSGRAPAMWRASVPVLTGPPPWPPSPAPPGPSSGWDRPATRRAAAEPATCCA